MSRSAVLKRTQVKGERYDLPAEEVEIEKLIQKGLSLEKRAKDLKQEIEEVKGRLTEIAIARRQNTTTVNLKAISGEVLITFRESYVCGADVEDLQLELKDLFPRFFAKKVEFSVTKELTKFLESGHALGLPDPDPIKEKILAHLSKKEIKPNVKIIPLVAGAE